MICVHLIATKKTRKWNSPIKKASSYHLSTYYQAIYYVKCE